MVLVLPLSKADSCLARLLLDRIVHLGCCRDVRIFLVGHESVRSVLEELVQTHLTNLPNLTSHVLDHVRDDEGWPRSCNDMFVATCRLLNSLGNRSPFYFMEADCVPMRAGWFQELRTAWGSGRARGINFYGAVKPMRFTRETGETVEDGTYLMGSAIYPPGFPDGFTILANFMRNTKDPWDVYLRHDIRKRGVADTGLIQDNWRTVNYRRSLDGTLICDPLGAGSRPEPIRPGAVVVHGCKDDSLHRCLQWCNMPAYTPEPVSEADPLPAVKKPAKTKKATRRRKRGKKPAKTAAK